MSQAKSFVKEVLARFKGDTDKVVAEKNYRKASAGISGQIAALNAKLVEEEGRVEDAKEALEAVKYPTDLITDVSSYVKNIKDKQEAYDKAKGNLEGVQETLTSYKDLMAGFDQESAE